MTSSAALRLGILGTGRIASAMAADLDLLDDVEVVAVGSRTDEGAQRFAEAHDVPRAHGSYEALVTDPDVDAVYVTTPHPGHRHAALLAIAAGKHVLVEKPFTMDAAQAREVVAAARERGVHPGYALGRDYEGMDDVLLVAVTEKRSPADVDRLAEVLAEVGA